MRILVGLLAVFLTHVTYADPAKFHADIRYRICPRTGEFVALKHTCNDRDLRDRLLRVIRKLPIVTVHQDGTLDLNVDIGKVFAPDRQILHEDINKVVGWWLTSTPSITMGVSIEERPSYPPRVEVVVKQINDDKSWCASMWVGGGGKF